MWYSDYRTQALRHAWWDGRIWTFEDFGPRPSSGGITATSFDGYPHVFLSVGQGYNVVLVHEWWTGSQWLSEELDGFGVPPGPGRTSDSVGGTYITSLMYGPGPQVFYQDMTTGALRQAWWDGQKWNAMELFGAGPGVRGVTMTPTASILWNGTPFVTFHYVFPGPTPSSTAIAAFCSYRWDGIQWSRDCPDGIGSYPGQTINDDVGIGTSLVPFAGQIHAFYIDLYTSSLRHYWASLGP
jgi:hypothetical protein